MYTKRNLHVLKAKVSKLFLFLQEWPWNACAWSAEDMRDWIKGNFGPAIERANMGYLKILIYEHSRDQLSTYPPIVSEIE